MKKFKTKSRSPALRARERTVHGTSRLYQARLLNPQEVERASRNCTSKLQEQMKGLWVLNATVRDETFATLKTNARSGLLTQIAAFPTETGAAYAVLVGQLGTWQHRIVLPLYDAKVMGLLRTLATEPLNVRLTNGKGNDDGLLFEYPFPKEGLTEVVAHCVEINFDNGPAFGVELAVLIAELLNPRSMLSCIPGHRIVDVDVSVLMTQSAKEGQPQGEGNVR